MKISEKTLESLKNKSLEARRLIAQCSFNAKLEHVGSTFSEIDILTVLYSGILNINPQKPKDPDRDRFVLSKGHGVLGLYVVLHQAGFIDKKDLDNYGKNGSKLAGHPVYNSAPGIEMSTGSLGHGLNVGVGLSLSAKSDRKKWKTFVMISDGECNEGSTWEAIFFAGFHKLKNLVVIVDMNKIQSLGFTKDVLDMKPFGDKWKNAGWEVLEIDGHDFNQITSALSNIPKKRNKPTVIIANTIKGKGWKGVEDTVDSHYKILTKEELDNLLKNLN